MQKNNHATVDIPYVNIELQYEHEREEILAHIDNLLSSGLYIGGDTVETFENNIKHYIGTPYSVALNSGTDALLLALRSLDIQEHDEIITQPNSFIASAGAIMNAGANIVFADVLDDQQINPSQIEQAITKNTKAIMPVHLTGRMGNMNAIMNIAKAHNLYVIEDAAQAIGSTYNTMNAGSIGHFGAFSAHPLKNLNAIGDAGYVTGRDKELMKRIKLMSNHGLVNRNNSLLWGGVSRLDAIQACVLNIRLQKLETVINKRINNAVLYKEMLNKDYVYHPDDRTNCRDTYHTFVIQVDQRDMLQEYLLNKGIQTAIHYPIPIHLQTIGRTLGYKEGDFPNAEKQANHILTLPIHQYLQEQDIIYIADIVNSFFTKR